jgi:AcrR family transcriptional regulator
MLSGTDRKKEILRVSQKLFGEKGYLSTSVRDIARELGIEPPSLYSHVNSKEDILEQICFDMAEKFRLAIEEVNDIYFDAPQKLKLMVHAHIQILTSNPDAAAVFVREWRHLKKSRLTEFVALRDQYERGIRAVLQTGVDEEKFNLVDVKFAALTILSTLNWIVEWYDTKGALTSHQVAERLYHFILTGLRKDVAAGLN